MGREEFGLTHIEDSRLANRMRPHIKNLSASEQPSLDAQEHQELLMPSFPAFS